MRTIVNKTEICVHSILRELSETTARSNVENDIANKGKYLIQLFKY